MAELRDLQIAHSNRNAAYPACAEWTLADWGNALAGEVGEACNIIKKIRRNDFPEAVEAAEARRALMAELADVISYTCLIADALGLDLQAAHRLKFNEVNRRIGYVGDL